MGEPAVNRKSLFLFFLTALCLFFVFSRTSAAQGPKSPDIVGVSVAPMLSLKQAYDKAVDANPVVRQAKENVNQYGYEVPLARSYLYPNISATGEAERRKDPPNMTNALFRGDPYDEYTAGIHGSQALFQVGIFSAVDVAKKDRQISQYNLEITARNLGTNVIQAYFQVVLNMRIMESLERQLQILSESFKTTQRRVRTGRNQMLDVLQVKTQISLVTSQVNDAKNQMEISAANLANLLGEPKSKYFTVKDTIGAPDLSLVDRDVDLKKFYLPEIEQNKIQISQMDDKIEVTRGQNLPTLSLFGDYNFISFKDTELFNQDSNGWDVGLMLTIPIFSGFSSLSQVDQLKSQKLQLEYAKQNLENNTTLQQITSRKQVETAHDNVLEGEEALRLAKESSDEAIKQYRFATIDFLNFLSIQTAYVQAEESLYTYRYNYVVALVNYYSASGQNLGHLVDMLEAANR